MSEQPVAAAPAAPAAAAPVAESAPAAQAAPAPAVAAVPAESGVADSSSKGKCPYCGAEVDKVANPDGSFTAANHDCPGPEKASAEQVPTETGVKP